MKTGIKRRMSGLIGMVVVLTLIAACSGNNNNAAQSSPPASASPSASASESPAAEDNVYPENGLPKDEEVTLSFGFLESGYGRGWMDNAIARFTEKYPNVTINLTSSPTIATLISTKIAAKNDEDMFDIITPSLSSEDEKIQTVRAGLFEDLTDQWERELPDSNGVKLKDLVIDGAVDAYKIDGKNYEIALGAYTVGLFYDKAFFRENGWNENPKTWDEFLALMEAIKSKGVIPITYPGVYPGYLDFAFKVKQFELAERNGNLEQYVQNYRTDTLPIVATEENKEVWSRIYELGQKGYFPEGVGAINHTQSQMQMLQRKAALSVTGNWIQNEMADTVPEGFEWGFMAIPFGDTAGDTIWVENGISSGGVMIWKNKPELNKAWAKEFNLFLLTNEIQAYNAASSGLYPVRKDFLENDDNVAQLQAAPRAVMEYSQNNNIRYGTTSKQVTHSHPSAAAAGKLISEMVVEVTAGKKDPLPVLAEAEKLMEEVIASEQ